MRPTTWSSQVGAFEQPCARLVAARQPRSMESSGYVAAPRSGAKRRRALPRQRAQPTQDVARQPQVRAGTRARNGELAARKQRAQPREPCRAARPENDLAGGVDLPAV